MTDAVTTGKIGAPRAFSTWTLPARSCPHFGPGFDWSTDRLRPRSRLSRPAGPAPAEIDWSTDWSTLRLAAMMRRSSLSLAQPGRWRWRVDPLADRISSPGFGRAERIVPGARASPHHTRAFGAGEHSLALRPGWPCPSRHSFGAGEHSLALRPAWPCPQPAFVRRPRTFRATRAAWPCPSPHSFGGGEHARLGTRPGHAPAGTRSVAENPDTVAAHPRTAGRVASAWMSRLRCRLRCFQ
jgi:hypothetical protein